MQRYIRLLCLGLLLLTGIGLLAQDNDLTDLLPLSEDITYSVQIGDTLDTIGALFDVAPSCIMEDNDIERASTLLAGDQLLISVDCPVYGADPVYNGQAFVEFPRSGVIEDGTCTSGYRIQNATSYADIEELVNASAEALQEANGDLTVGACLVIPADAPPAMSVPTDAETSEMGGGAEIYVVRRGDTLSTIAERFGISLISLRMTNEIDNPRSLQPGDRLVIPADAADFGTVPIMDEDFDPEQGGGADTYVIQPGDVLDTIARENDINLECLMESNEIEVARRIRPGDVIILTADCGPYVGPGAGVVSVISPAATSNTSSDTGSSDTTPDLGDAGIRDASDNDSDEATPPGN